MAHAVSFSPQARDDLTNIYLYIARQADADTAIAYIERIEAFCLRLSTFPERGTPRRERPGLRIIGFERRASIAFAVRPGRVVIQRVLYGGRNVEAAVHPV